MTASYSIDDGVGGRGPLDAGATPADIRAKLLPEDRIGFDRALDAALAEVRTSLDLTGLFTMLERWRRLALAQQDHVAFARTARRAAEKLTGEIPPEDESLAVTRSRTGM
ncbi:DUF6247 family protein [Actinomycetospora chlora]|uniref:DUF6247 family protein n=1 Tax=Actinomycetospora chlora TaxID=663608 RepID=UPI0031F143D5